MSSKFTPPAGNIEVVEGLILPKKYPLLPGVPRAFPKGTPMWLMKWASGAYYAEPALLAAQGNNLTTTPATRNSSVAGDSTSVEHANGVFAALFLGFALEPRFFQQEQAFLSAGMPGGGVNYGYGDASAPFLSVADEGIAVAPLDPTTYTTGALTANVEVGTLVDLGGFQNEATTGFYDPSGTLQQDTDYYLYNNAVKTTATAANAIGVVCERGLIGDTFLKFKFKSYILGGVALG